MAGALRRSGFPLGVLVLVCATADAREAGAPLQPRPTRPEVTRAAHHDASNGIVGHVGVSIQFGYRASTHSYRVFGEC